MNTEGMQRRRTYAWHPVCIYMYMRAGLEYLEVPDPLIDLWME